MYEVELKFRDEDGEFTKFLESKEFSSEKSTTDEYFDVEDSYDLFLKGIFIRLRTKNNKQVLDFKFDDDNVCDDKHEYCVEKSFILPLEKDNSIENITKILNLKHANTFEDFLKINNLITFVKIVKDRKVFKINEFEISADYVKDLGNFIEIEVQEDNKKKLDERVKDIKEFVKDFNLTIINTGYVELFLKQDNPELYEKGRFKE